MTTEEHELAEYAVALLQPLRDQSLGPTSIDLARAVRDGGHRVRRRNLAVAGAALAVLAIVGASVLGIGPAQRTIGPAVTVTPSVPTISAWGFSTRYVDAPPPPGFSVRLIAMARYTQQITLVRTVDGQRRTTATIVLWPPSLLPTFGGEPLRLDREHVAPLRMGGHQAYWADDCQQAECLQAHLCWEWNTHAWVCASAVAEATPAHPNPTKAESRAEALTIAAVVDTSRRIPIRTPVRAPAPPGMVLAAIVSQAVHGDPVDSTSLVFTPEDDLLLPGDAVPQHRTATVTLEADMVAKPDVTTTAVVGRPAQFRARPSIDDEETVLVPNWLGRWGLSFGSDIGLFDGVAEKTSYLGRVTIVSDPDDQGSWLSLP